jgi:hypothetical protein
VPRPARIFPLKKRHFGLALGSLFLVPALLVFGQSPTLGASLPDQTPSDTVGSIEGDSISVQGPMTVQVVNGLVKTILRSGSDIRVKSGRAEIDLVEGGRIVVCGPAHLTILKSGGALTLALESGTVHVYITHAPALTVYTPQIQAQPFAIGEGRQDALVGFDSPGAMCIRAKFGAIRLNQQFTGQKLIVPQGGDVMVTNGQLDAVQSGTGRCSCELEMASIPPPHMNTEASFLASAAESEPKPLAASGVGPPASPAGSSDQPIYHVFMPPLRYDANAKIQDVPDPHLIMLVRQVRVRPTLIFEGRVEGNPVVAENTSQQIIPAQRDSKEKMEAKKPPSQQASDSMVDRVKSFFRRLWSGNS